MTKKPLTPEQLEARRAYQRRYWKKKYKASKATNGVATQEESDGLYKLFTPTEPATRSTVVVEQRIRRIVPLLKDMQVGQAFAIERVASAWAHYWLKKNYPTKRFVISKPRDKRLPATVRLLNARASTKR